MIIAPSILSCDFSDLKGEIESVSNAEYIHVDVMDGHFVPNITIGPVVLKSIGNIKKQVYDVHLMISDPTKYMIDFAKAKADIITFHYEALDNKSEIIKLINNIKKLGIKAGISIKPNTDVKVLDDYLDIVDLILVMSVEPGFGGQKFMPYSLEKIKYLSETKKKHNYKYLIEVDGGINDETIKLVSDAGVEVCVAGSFIFSYPRCERNELINKLKEY
ncbi:MAG: ribulose-phosphate 3-epimerase [Bacilli bacterium]|nr:ribulose-phosphate 3-epimerase [Bacilli bacterium]